MFAVIYFFTNFADNQSFNQENEKDISTFVFSSVHALCFIAVQFMWTWNSRGS